MTTRCIICGGFWLPPGWRPAAAIVVLTGAHISGYDAGRFPVEMEATLANQHDPVQSLLGGPISIINIGLEAFSIVLQTQNVAVVQVDWSPPAGGDAKMIELLEKLGV